MPLTRVVVSLLVVGAAVAADWPHAEWLDGSADVLVRRAYLPSDRNVHGEFRLLDRRGAICGQTLLYTPSLRRALQRISKKELRAWPESAEGHADSQRYLAALDAVRERVLTAPGTDHGLETLGIEFVLADDASLFALYALDVTESDGTVTVEALRPLYVEVVSPGYVARALELMQQSAFRDTESEEDEP